MRTVALKQTASDSSVMVSLQNPNVSLGYNASGTLTVHVIDVPDTVTDLEVVRLYYQTSVYHTTTSDFIVPFTLLGVGKIAMIRRDDLVGLAEAAVILGWDKRKLSTYISRGVLPEPIQRLASGPIWTREQIETYRDARN